MQIENWAAIFRLKRRYMLEQTTQGREQIRRLSNFYEDTYKYVSKMAFIIL